MTRYTTLCGYLNLAVLAGNTLTFAWGDRVTATQWLVPVAGFLLCLGYLVLDELEQKLATARRALSTVLDLDANAYLDNLDSNMRAAGKAAYDALEVTA